MNIHEYQARQLLRDHGIPVQPESLSRPATEGPRTADKMVLAIYEFNKPLHHHRWRGFFSLQDWSIYAL